MGHPISLWSIKAGDSQEQKIVDHLIEAERERSADVQSLSRLQHYTASDRRFGVQADMLARMYYERGKGKRFEVISRSGSNTIQSRIFDGLLAAEVDAARQYVKSGSLITTANYKFRLLGDAVYSGHSCYQLELQAREKSQHLINGKAWVDATDFAIIHEEGRPSASVSFWIGKPMITEDYQKIGKYWVALRRHSSSDSLLLGRSELSVDYSDYKIVGTKPEDPR